MMRPKTQTVRPAVIPPAVSYRATALPSGRLLPIEVRIGRRLLRTIPVESVEARDLLRAGRVEIVSTEDAASTSTRPSPQDH